MISFGRPISKILGGFLFAAIGMFLLVVFLLSTMHKDYISSTAKVIKKITNEQNEEVSILQLEIEGEVYELEGIRGINYNIGDDISIKYNPENPNEYDIGGDTESNITAIILGVVLLLLGCIGIITGVNDVRFITNTLKKY